MGIGSDHDHGRHVADRNGGERRPHRAHGDHHEEDVRGRHSGGEQSYGDDRGKESYVVGSSEVFE